MFLEPDVHLLREGADLSLGVTRGDDEQIEDLEQATHIEDDDVPTLLGVQSVGGNRRQLFRLEVDA